MENVSNVNKRKHSGNVINVKQRKHSGRRRGGGGGGGGFKKRNVMNVNKQKTSRKA